MFKRLNKAFSVNLILIHLGETYYRKSLNPKYLIDLV